MFFSSHFTSHLITDYSVFNCDLREEGPRNEPESQSAICYLPSAISFEPKARMTSPSLVGEKFAAHGDLDPIAFWILYFADLHRKVDRAHDAVTELLVDQLFDCFSVN
jgi:hypothetical protein